jgi:predicted lipid-binding transport protein (Tim44 family)
MLGVFAASALFTVLVVTPVHAQQPADQHHTQPPAATSPTPPAGPGMSGPMMDMCRQMMGGQAMGGQMMGTPMMGAAGPMDPKQRAAMMEMRGEMMKAMGDIMMKHARRMQGPPDK